MIAENFIIDPLKPNDAHQLYQFMVDNNERLHKFFPVTLSGNDTIEKSTAYIALKEKEIREKTNFTFAIREKETQKIAGLIILKKIDWPKKQGEFAYCIGSQYEGKGLVTFAVKELSGYAFNQLDLKTLKIISHKTTLGSVKVAEKCGFIWRRTLPEEFTPSNEKPLDMELYELTHEK